MNTSEVKNTSLKKNKLALGTVQFGIDYGINNDLGKVKEEEALDIVNYAFQNGIYTLDTAQSYGRAEQILGNILIDNPFNNNIEIITKIKFKNNLTLDQNIEISCRNLRREVIDTLLFHTLEDYKMYSNKQELNEMSNVTKIGVSVYNNDQIESVLDDTRIKVIQLPFNLLDNESIRGDILRRVQAKGKEVHTRSSFLQGLFFMDMNKRSNVLSVLRVYLERIHALCNDYNISMSDLALSYCLSKSYIDKVIIGVDSLSQLKINIESSNSTVPHELIETVDGIHVAELEMLNPNNWK